MLCIFQPSNPNKFFRLCLIARHLSFSKLQSDSAVSAGLTKIVNVSLQNDYGISYRQQLVSHKSPITQGAETLPVCDSSGQLDN